MATAEVYHTQSLYTNSSESIHVHRRTRLRDLYERAPYIAHLLLFVEYWNCVLLRGGVIRGGIVLYTIVL